MEKGKIKFFNAQQGKRFGFAVMESGKEIFFHYSDGEFIVAGKTQPEFSGKAQMMIQGKSRSLRDPQRDDVIMFNRAMGSKGEIASPWGYWSQYERALAAIANRPTYRVLEAMTSSGAQPREPKVLWEGSILDELRKKYPVPSSGKSISADPLIPFWSDPDNTFEVQHWFEQKISTGWEKCPDPRR